MGGVSSRHVQRSRARASGKAASRACSGDPLQDSTPPYRTPWRGKREREEAFRPHVTLSLGPPSNRAASLYVLRAADDRSPAHHDKRDSQHPNSMHARSYAETIDMVAL
eukprot:1166919-Rhodomonas_salina.2